MAERGVDVLNEEDLENSKAAYVPRWKKVSLARTTPTCFGIPVVFWSS